MDIVYFHLLVIAALSQLSTANTAFNETCPAGWIHAPNGHCYYFSTTCVSWFRANFVCKRLGGNLVTLETRDEIDFIREVATTTHKPFFWTGAIDFFQNGYYVWWPTNEEVKCFDWAPGEPKPWPGGDQLCIMMWGPRSYTWKDEHCFYLKYFICEAYPGSDAFCTCNQRNGNQNSNKSGNGNQNSNKSDSRFSCVNFWL